MTVFDKLCDLGFRNNDMSVSCLVSDLETHYALDLYLEHNFSKYFPLYSPCKLNAFADDPRL